MSRRTAAIALVALTLILSMPGAVYAVIRLSALVTDLLAGRDLSRSVGTLERIELVPVYLALYVGTLFSAFRLREATRVVPASVFYWSLATLTAAAAGYVKFAMLFVAFARAVGD